MANEAKPNDREKLYDLIKDVKIAMLTTVETDGSLHTRPMANQEADENGDLWFFTEKDGGVARNVATNPQVSLGFSDPRSSDYVAVSGVGAIIDDRATIDAHWSEIMVAWFPKGKDDPNLVLLKVDPVRGEFWDTKSGLLYVLASFVKSKLTGSGPANALVDQAKVML